MRYFVIQNDHNIKKRRTPQCLNFFLNLLVSFGISTNICGETKVNSCYLPKTRHNGLQSLIQSPIITRFSCIFCRKYITSHSLIVASVIEMDGFGSKSCLCSKNTHVKHLFNCLICVQITIISRLFIYNAHNYLFKLFETIHHKYLLNLGSQPSTNSSNKPYHLCCSQRYLCQQ